MVVVSYIIKMKKVCLAFILHIIFYVPNESISRAKNVTI